MVESGSRLLAINARRGASGGIGRESKHNTLDAIMREARKKDMGNNTEFLEKHAYEAWNEKAKSIDARIATTAYFLHQALALYPQDMDAKKWAKEYVRMLEYFACLQGTTGHFKASINMLKEGAEKLKLYRLLKHAKELEEKIGLFEKAQKSMDAILLAEIRVECLQKILEIAPEDMHAQWRAKYALNIMDGLVNEYIKNFECRKLNACLNSAAKIAEKYGLENAQKLRWLAGKFYGFLNPEGEDIYPGLRGKNFMAEFTVDYTSYYNERMAKRPEGSANIDAIMDRDYAYALERLAYMRGAEGNLGELIAYLKEAHECTKNYDAKEAGRIMNDIERLNKQIETMEELGGNIEAYKKELGWLKDDCKDWLFGGAD